MLLMCTSRFGYAWINRMQQQRWLHVSQNPAGQLLDGGVEPAAVV
jgi:hypothetical protein